MAAPDSINKVEMHLSAFGVESDDYPSIDVIIDFTQDTSYCSKWFYNPSHKPSTYKLSIDEMRRGVGIIAPVRFEEAKIRVYNQRKRPTYIYNNNLYFV
jgi:hypothetical protein